MGLKQRLDVVLWAHSDQVGGTEIPCVLASALRRRAGNAVACGIFTPMPVAVADYFKLVVGRRRGIAVVSTADQKDRATGLELAKSPRGYVDGSATAKLVLERFGNGRLQQTIARYVSLLRSHSHRQTLVVSCGEPLALEAAKQCGLKAVIVTDHLLTLSVEGVLRDAGTTGEIALENLAIQQAFDRNADQAILSPPEFGMADYRPYLAKGRLKALEIGGLFYDPIPQAELIAAPHYQELVGVNERYPLVIVFAGGGKIWDDIYLKLAKDIQTGKLDEAKFAIVMRHTQDGIVIPRTWRLYQPGDRAGRPLDDPGRMMYWYAACSLLVGRGGLAAQQTLATILSDAESVPTMLFVEEPGHPQIEAERRALHDLGLVASCPFHEYEDQPFDLIRTTLATRNEELPLIRQRVRLRYARGKMDEIADILLRQYTPHLHDGGSWDVASAAGPYDFGRAFFEDFEDRLDLPGALEGRQPPQQLEIHPPSAGGHPCWLQCPHCYQMGSSPASGRLDEETAVRMVRDFKGRSHRIVISGAYSDPLSNPRMTTSLLFAAREGAPHLIGLHTKLLAFPDEVKRAIFNGCHDGDYLTVSLDAGTADTYGVLTGRPADGNRNLDAVRKNLESFAGSRDEGSYPVRLNIVCLLTEHNSSVAEINALYDIACQNRVDVLRFSVPQPPTAAGVTPSGAIPSGVFEHIRQLAQRSSKPDIVFMDYSHWSASCFTKCYAQLYFPAVGADGYVYPCCQVAGLEAFQYLRLFKADSSRNNWELWSKSEQRLKLIAMPVGERHGSDPKTLRCRVCNRHDGAVNALLWSMTMNSPVDLTG